MTARWWRRIRYLLTRRQHEEDLVDEMTAHRDLLREPLRFGSLLRLREESRDAWGWGWLDAIARDVRQAVRSLGQARGYAAAIVLPLAAGIAVLAVMLSVANAYLVRPLPYPDAGQLYHLSYAPPGPYEPNDISEIDWTTLRDVVEYPIVARSDEVTLDGHASASQVTGMRISAGFIAGLTVHAALGRTLQQGDFLPDGSEVALIGDRLWHAEFGADSAVVGRVIRIDTEGAPDPITVRIVGVLPAGFWFGRESSALVDMLLPLRTAAAPYLVRLRHGVAPAFAEQRITQAVRVHATNLPAGWTGAHLESMRARYVAGMRPVLVTLVGAAALLLIVVCGNVAVLVLLRAIRRRHEVDIRVALGAERRHVLRLLAIEPLLLCGIATLVALGVGSALLGALTPLIERRLGRPAPSGIATLTLDPAVVVTIVAIAFITAWALALTPMVTSRRSGLAAALRGGARNASEGRPANRTRSLLVVAEIAGAVVLLAACGSSLRTVLTLANTHLGFRTTELVRVATVVPSRSYPDSAALRAYYQRLSHQVEEVMGSPVALVYWPPYYEAPSSRYSASVSIAEQGSAGLLGVGPHYFGLLDIPLRSGREFTDADLPGAEPVAIVSETLAHSLWPDGTAVGRPIRVADMESAAGPSRWRTIVGIVADVRQTYHDRDLRDIYVPYLQGAPGRYGSFYVQTIHTPDAVAHAVRAAMATTDPAMVVRHVTTPADEDTELRSARFLAGVAVAFGAFATLLALLGTCAVVGYAVRLREREVAIRVAVGATAPMVTRMFMVSGVRLLAVGISAGIVMTVITGRLLATTVGDIGLVAPVTLLSAAGMMAATGVLATWWPAHFAGRGEVVARLTSG